jgi:hypothetical protein
MNLLLEPDDILQLRKWTTTVEAVTTCHSSMALGVEEHFRLMPVGCLLNRHAEISLSFRLCWRTTAFRD